MPCHTRPVRLLLLVLVLCHLTLVLDGCGFRLRGSLGDNIALPPVYLEGMPGSAIMVELRQILQSTGTQIAAERSRATYVLNIINEQHNRRILSVSPAGRVQEYDLYYTVIFTVADSNGNKLLDNQNISYSRSYSFAETDVLAKASEEQALIAAMRQDAVQGIIRRMQALPPPQTDDVENQIETETGTP